MFLIKIDIKGSIYIKMMADMIKIKKNCLAFCAVIFLLSLLFIPMIYAQVLSNPVTIKTDPGQLLSVRITDFVTKEKIQIVDITTDDSGIANFIISYEMKSTVFKIMFISEGKVVNSISREIPLIGRPVLIDLINTNNSSAATNTTGTTTNQSNLSAVNSTLNNSNSNTDTQTANTSNVSSFSFQGFTGAIIEDIGNFFFEIKNYIFIALGGIVVIVILFFAFKKFRKASSDIKVGHGNYKVKIPVSGKDGFDRRLMDAERKLKEAQEEINRIKNVDRIKEVQRRMEADKAELDRLRRGY